MCVSLQSKLFTAALTGVALIAWLDFGGDSALDSTWLGDDEKAYLAERLPAKAPVRLLSARQRRHDRIISHQ